MYLYRVREGVRDRERQRAHARTHGGTHEQERERLKFNPTNDLPIDFSLLS